MPETPTLSVHTEQKDWLSIRETARIFGFNEEYVRVLLREGKLTGWKTGPSPKSSWRVSRAAVEEIMERNSNQRQLATAV